MDRFASPSESALSEHRQGIQHHSQDSIYRSLQVIPSVASRSGMFLFLDHKY